MEDSVTRGIDFYRNVSFFIAIVLTIIFLVKSVYSYSNTSRETYKNNNITGVETYSTMQDYEGYPITGDYDGTYSLTETYSYVKNNIFNYEIYISKNGIVENLNTLMIGNRYLKDYIEDGNVSALKSYIFDSLNDSNAHYLCYIDAAEDGTINAVYFLREVN